MFYIIIVNKKKNNVSGEPKCKPIRIYYIYKNVVEKFVTINTLKK